MGLISIFIIFTEKQKECLPLYNGTSVIPHSWYHVCVGIDTVSGLLRIVDNGVLVFDEEKEMLRNSSSIKPNNLEGKLLGSV